MTFRAWRIISKPGDMTYKGMMRHYRVVQLSNHWATGWAISLAGWCIDFYHENKRLNDLDDWQGYNLRKHWYGETDEA